MTYEDYGAACVDCIQAIANDDFTALDYHYTPERAAQRERDIREGIAAAPGPLVIGDDVDEFSSAACDVCGSWLAGERHSVGVLV